MSSEWLLEDRLDLSPFDHLEPARVLLELEQPWVFVSKNRVGQKVLAYFVEELEQPDFVRRHVVSPTTDSIVEQLVEGAISVFDALTVSWMWVIDVDSLGEVRAAFNVDADSLPTGALPPRTTMLHAGLEPAIVLRFTGEEIEEGSIPANVLAVAGSAVQDALKPLSKFVSSQRLPAGGRRSDYERAFYNLSAQRIGFGSLEVAFKRPNHPESLFPEAPESAAGLEAQMWEMLRKGLNWASSTDASNVDSLAAESDDERLAILKALQALAPSASSVTSVAVGGRYVSLINPNSRVSLSRENSKLIREATSTVRERIKMVTESKVVSGWVRDLDLDRRVLTVRESPDAQSLKGLEAVIESDESLQTARDAHYFDKRVELVASRERQQSSKADVPWTVTQLSIIPDDGDVLTADVEEPDSD